MIKITKNLPTKEDYIASVIKKQKKCIPSFCCVL